MAAEADKVVVELIAKTDGFDAKMQASAGAFEQSTKRVGKAAQETEQLLATLRRNLDDALSSGNTQKAQLLAANIERIEAAAKKAGVGVASFDLAITKGGVSAGRARMGMQQLGFQAQDVAQQFALGVKPMTIFAQQGGQVIQALQLMGSGGSKFLAFLGGPWGVGLSVAAVALTPLIAKLFESKDGVADLVEKLKEHARQTALSEEADRVWSSTLDGLIDRQRQHNEELSKRLQIQPLADQADLQQARSDREALQKELDDAKKRLADLQRRLAAASAPGQVTVGFAGPAQTSVTSAVVGKQIKETEADIKRLQSALATTEGNITKSLIVIGQTEGKALADLSAAAQLFGQKYEGVITQIIKDNPKLGTSATQIEATGAALIKAAEDAASAGVDFHSITNQVEGIDRRLDTGKIGVRTYATEIGKLTKSLNAMTEAAKEAAKIDPVKQFKQSVIGAEGTGPNKAGSPAAGFGQFMPGTWRSYFDKLFPDKASLDDAAKLAYRNVRSVAEAVIDKATDDYIAVLKTAGQKITAANLYTVHVLGAPDAAKFFSAQPGQSARSALGGNAHADRIVAQNGNIFTGTVAQAQAALAKRIGDSSSAVSQAAVAIAQAMQQEKERLAQYQAEKDVLESQVIEARKGLAKDAEAVWAFETAAVIAAHKHTEDEIAAQEVAGKLLPQEAIELKKINDERAKYRQQLVDQRLRQAQFAQAEENFGRGRDFQTGSYEAEAELLRSQEGLARTATQRREIEQRLIDLQFAEERLKNQYIIDWAERVKANKDATDKEKADAALAAQIAEMHQGTLDQRHDNATRQNSEQNASPLQAYFNSIPNTAQEINDAFENIAANGLATFNDALANAIVHFTSLSDVARTVLGQLATDLIKFALQQVELHTIGAVLSAASVATTTAAAAAAGAAWAGPAALASLATLGANAGPASAAIASTVGLATILGAPKAGGGRITGPGTDTSDNILTPMSPGEFAIRATSARAIGYDVLEHMNRTGEIPDGMAMGGAIRPTNARASHAGGGRGGVTSDDITRLERAIDRSRSDISLYASLDPADMMQRALGTPAGSRALLAHLGANSTAVKATLNHP